MSICFTFTQTHTHTKVAKTHTLYRVELVLYTVSLVTHKCTYHTHPLEMRADIYFSWHLHYTHTHTLRAEIRRQGRAYVVYLRSASPLPHHTPTSVTAESTLVCMCVYSLRYRLGICALQFLIPVELQPNRKEQQYSQF